MPVTDRRHYTRESAFRTGADPGSLQTRKGLRQSDRLNGDNVVSVRKGCIRARNQTHAYELSKRADAPTPERSYRTSPANVPSICVASAESAAIR